LKRKNAVDAEPREISTDLDVTNPKTVLDALDITMVEITKERVVATMPISSKHHQIIGYLHGGVSVLLAETVASIGSTMHIDMQRQMAFGLEINANHLRPKRAGQLSAVATPIHLGRTTHVWDVRITDERDKLICISRCTVAVVDRPSAAGGEPAALADR
jgi:1,4-dihydroxy-2-naphthoyl-CoA hydrolase